MQFHASACEHGANLEWQQRGNRQSRLVVKLNDSIISHCKDSMGTQDAAKLGLLRASSFWCVALSRVISAFAPVPLVSARYAKMLS
jgi:hypothetical protein